jgi:hypothetical protein
LKGAGVTFPPVLKTLSNNTEGSQSQKSPL